MKAKKTAPRRTQNKKLRDVAQRAAKAIIESLAPGESTWGDRWCAVLGYDAHAELWKYESDFANTIFVKMREGLR